MQPTEESGAPAGAQAPSDQTEALVSGSGSYDLLKKRLETQGEGLLKKTQALNERRLAEFGRSEQALVLRTRARTENNAVSCALAICFCLATTSSSACARKRR
jgi:hypothetical protein